MRIFETLKPKSAILKKYISYYYLDIADQVNYFNEYICYPHYNNTISLYKNHHVEFAKQHSILTYNKSAGPLQIFTPIREETLKVTQQGSVYKIGIVFEPFGINQFLAINIAINKRVSSPIFKFFEDNFIQNLFNTTNFNDIVSLLDQELQNKLNPKQNLYIKKALQILHTSTKEFNIDELANTQLGISRKHLNRLFGEHLGTTPQKYRTIVRFRQLMNYKLNNKEQQNLTSLAHQVHYTDQSHFIKACKQLTGLTPSQFFKDGKIVGSEDTFWNFTG